MFRPIFSIIFCSLFLFGCASVREVPGERFFLDAPFELALGESAHLDSGDLTVTFLGVPSDSRCPEGATCIWVGDVQANLLVEQDGQKVEALLIKDANNEMLSSAPLEGYTLTLVDVLPYPKMGDEKEGRLYKARLLVSLGPI